jgi:tRNA (guanine-N7-)-methyltransferase
MSTGTMSRRTKPERYQDILSLPNVLDLHYYSEGDHAPVRGNWRNEFGNDAPITLELACGKGEYCLGLGARYPNRNFLGLDIKGDRIWKGAKQALDTGLENVRFLRTRIDHLTNYFAPDEIDEIWITFPDPYLKRSKKRKRLTHPVFLRRYARILRSGGPIHLKTDSDELYAFTLAVLEILNLPIKQQISDLYRLDKIPENLDIQTYYEKQHLSSGKAIKYVAFTLNDGVNASVSGEIDKLS